MELAIFLIFLSCAIYRSGLMGRYGQVLYAWGAMRAGRYDAAEGAE